MPDNWPDPTLQDEDHFVSDEGPDWQMNACVGPQLPQQCSWSYYSDGFLIGAQCIVNKVQEDRSVPVDIAVYPVLFLYRHHFELVLKCLIRASRSLLREEVRSPSGHRLVSLWETAAPLIEQCFPDADWSQNVIVSRLIMELAEIDPDGQRFRYPMAQDGSRSLEDTPLLNIRHFAQTAEKLSAYLRQVLRGIEIDDELRTEWEAEMMSEYWGE